VTSTEGHTWRTRRRLHRQCDGGNGRRRESDRGMAAGCQSWRRLLSSLRDTRSRLLKVPRTVCEGARESQRGSSQMTQDVFVRAT
jgi:hypothetical protein